jgi:hypothetical protein
LGIRSKPVSHRKILIEKNNAPPYEILFTMVVANKDVLTIMPLFILIGRH